MEENNFMKTLKKVFRVAIIAFVLFLIFNLLIFIPVITKEKQDKLYPEARTYMLCANAINTTYIYPLSESFGWDSPITKPFYFIRDKLYNIGYSKFPKNEGEKEIWWFNIKFNEFDKLVENNLCDWGQNVPTPSKLISKKDKFISWDNDIYKHINLFAQAKITDKDFAKQQIEILNYVAYMYEYLDHILYRKIEEDRQIKAKIRKNVGIYISDKEVKKYEHVFNIQQNFLTQSKKNKTLAFEYYISKPYIWLFGEMFVHNTSYDILMSKFYSNKLQCNDPYIKVFTESHKKLREYYFEHQDEIPHGLRTNVGGKALSVDPLLAYKCKNNPYMKDYIQYILSKDENKNISSIDEIKDNILEGYKEYKDYDRLKQANSIGIK